MAKGGNTMSDTLENIAFHHIGKTGGTSLFGSINSVQYENGNKGLLELGVTSRGHSGRFNYGADTKVFFTVRDPIARMISGYYCKWFEKGWRKTPSEIESKKKGLSFNDFVTAWRTGEGELGKWANDLKNSSIHLGRMKKWYKHIKAFKDNPQKVIFVMFQETLRDDFNTIRSTIPRFSVLPDLPRHNSNPSTRNKTISEQNHRFLADYFKEDYEFVNACEALMHDKTGREVIGYSPSEHRGYVVSEEPMTVDGELPAYCIHLPRREDRHVTFSSGVGSKLPYEYFNAVDGQDISLVESYYGMGGSLACRASHAALWVKAIATNKTTIIFEDDCLLRDDIVWSDMKRDILDVVDKCDKPYILGFSSRRIPDVESPFTMWREWLGGGATFGTHAYVVSPSAAAILVDLYVRIPNPIGTRDHSVDHRMRNLCKKGLFKIYVHEKIHIYQTQKRSESDNDWKTIQRLGRGHKKGKGII